MYHGHCTKYAHKMNRWNRAAQCENVGSIIEPATQLGNSWTDLSAVICAGISTRSPWSISLIIIEPSPERGHISVRCCLTQLMGLGYIHGDTHIMGVAGPSLRISHSIDAGERLRKALHMC